MTAIFCFGHIRLISARDLLELFRVQFFDFFVGVFVLFHLYFLAFLYLYLMFARVEFDLFAARFQRAAARRRDGEDDI